MKKVPVNVLSKASEAELIDVKNRLEYSIHKLYSDLYKDDKLNEDKDIQYFLKELNNSQKEEEYRTNLILYINALGNHLSKAINSLSAGETIKLLTRGQGV